MPEINVKEVVSAAALHDNLRRYLNDISNGKPLLVFRGSSQPNLIICTESDYRKFIMPPKEISNEEE